MVEWQRLFRVACSLIDQVNVQGNAIDHWSFGGGTALMLHLGHRESRDVDIFLPDPQMLPLLDPGKRGFAFDLPVAGYGGDGAHFLKIAFEIGEIDFIVARALTRQPFIPTDVVGRSTLVESVAEIIAKKIVHRGRSITPRDIFDIAAAAIENPDRLVSALRPFKTEVASTVDAAPQF